MALDGYQRDGDGVASTSGMGCQATPGPTQSRSRAAASAPSIATRRLVAGVGDGASSLGSLGWEPVEPEDTIVAAPQGIGLGSDVHRAELLHGAL